MKQTLSFLALLGSAAAWEETDYPQYSSWSKSKTVTAAYPTATPWSSIYIPHPPPPVYSNTTSPCETSTVPLPPLYTSAPPAYPPPPPPPPHWTNTTTSFPSQTVPLPGTATLPPGTYTPPPYHTTKPQPPPLYPNSTVPYISDITTAPAASSVIPQPSTPIVETTPILPSESVWTTVLPPASATTEAPAPPEFTGAAHSNKPFVAVLAGVVALFALG